jgi:hypothetical protein
VTTAVAATSEIRKVDLRLPIPEVPFTSYTFNVGKRCICQPHVDGLNLASGLCLVVPLGSFDPSIGGHLVLHDLKLICEVAPGSICLIPSAIITHSNIGIQAGETRRALTAYTPGSYFQYFEEEFGRVENRTEEEATELGRIRWAAGKARFPHAEEMV